MELLVDPLVYILPREDAEYDKLMLYINYVQLWSEEWQLRKHQFYLSETCAGTIYQQGLCTYPEDLTRLWAYIGETDLSQEAVYTILAQVLANTPYLEDRIPGLRDIEIYEDDLRVRPDLVCRNIVEIQSAFRETLGRIAYAKAFIHHRGVDDLMLLTYPTDASVAQVQGQAETDLETVDINAEVRLISEPRELIGVLDLSEIWENTNLALRWEWESLVQNGVLDAESKMAPYSVDRGFNESILAQHLENTSVLEVLYRKCTLLLCGKNEPDGSSHHPLDKDHQRIVRRWGAWRMHITGRPSAYRLHYWRKGNEYILMKVCPYTDMSIADPPDEA